MTKLSPTLVRPECTAVAVNRKELCLVAWTDYHILCHFALCNLKVKAWHMNILPLFQ